MVTWSCVTQALYCLTFLSSSGVFFLYITLIIGLEVFAQAADLVSVGLQVTELIGHMS